MKNEDKNRTDEKRYHLKRNRQRKRRGAKDREETIGEDND